MTRAPGALPTPTVLDYERTLILAIERSNTSWVLAAQIPGLPGVKARRSILVDYGHENHKWFIRFNYFPDGHLDYNVYSAAVRIQVLYLFRLRPQTVQATRQS